MLEENDFVRNFETTLYKKDGSICWVAITTRVVRESAGAFLFYEGFIKDITENKHAEDALRTSLAEKEMLLKEVHHRVKNNLAAIMGLVGTQAQTLDNVTARSAMMELSIRIKSMSLVHEQLYQAENFSRIDFQSYLDILIPHLRSSYEFHGDIDINIAAMGVEMGLDSAVPCGLLITELVTNAFKYAFPTGRSHDGALRCAITVKAEWDGATYTVTVADNGVGLPAEVDWKTTETMGLLLVRMLGLHQLQGRMELDRRGGATFRLWFAPKD
jgi:two-component sensor histidine kinase